MPDRISGLAFFERRDYMQMYHYEKVEQEISQGDIVHNLNGTDYRVMERYSKSNYLMMSMSNGSFIVACDVASFMRYPKGGEVVSKEGEIGIEWAHGRYLSSTPSQIDFKALRTEYCEPYEQEGKEFQIEIREILSRVENVKADTLGDAIDQAMELYKRSEIVLDANDYKGVDYIPVEDTKSKR